MSRYFGKSDAVVLGWVALVATLKLTGAIDWTWIWIMMPVWIPVAIAVALTCFYSLERHLPEEFRRERTYQIGLRERARLKRELDESHSERKRLQQELDTLQGLRR